jgi:predicted neuraminidase
MLISTIALLTAVAADPSFAADLIFPQNPKHNHGSSIVETADGDLIACWFHGSGERQSDDVMVQGARKRKGEDKWCEPFVMADTPDLPDCNPVLFIDPRGTLWLFWITVQDNEWGGSLLKYRTSTQYKEDGPPKWDWQDVIHCRPKNFDTLFLGMLDKAEQTYAPLLAAAEDLKKEVAQARLKVKEKLPTRIGWMTRLHPIMLSDNRMMLGLYTDVFSVSLAGFTEDWGKTWSFSEPILELGNIQPSFVRKKNGNVMAYMRDNGLPHHIRVSESKDNGVTWSEVTQSEILNPGSSVECISLTSGAWVMVCNDTFDGRHWLTAYLSDDEGATWKWKRKLENWPDKEAGSASYPSVIQSADGTVHCTYSYVIKEVKGSSIKHVRFNEEWVKAGDPAEQK